MYRLTELLNLQQLENLPCFTEQLEGLTYDCEDDYTMRLYKDNKEVANDCYLNYSSKAECVLNLIYKHLNDLQEEVK